MVLGYIEASRSLIFAKRVNLLGIELAILSPPSNTEINYNITETQKPIKKDEIQNLTLIFLNNKTLKNRIYMLFSIYYITIYSSR